MSFMDFIGTAVDSVSDVASSAADSVSSGGSWWDTGLDWATSAFGWMEDNPVATKMLGGVVGGVGSYLTQRELQDREEKMLKQSWDRERQAQMITPGSVNNYGSYGGGFSNGLITNGMIAGYNGLKDR